MAQDDESAHRESFFGRIFGGSGLSEREEKVQEYIIHRLRNGAYLENVLQEEYVRSNCSQNEIDEVVREPRLVHEARMSLEQEFESGELDPDSVRRRQR
jgi:hypothetical protein